MASVSRVTMTGDNGTDSGFTGGRWSTGPGATVLTYSFPAEDAVWSATYDADTGDALSANFTPVTPTQQQAIEAALDLIAEVAGISFAKLGDESGAIGDLRFGQTDFSSSGTIARGLFPLPSSSPEGGDVWLSRGVFDGTITFGANGLDATSPGEVLWLLLHEISHALGLKHPHQSFSFYVDSRGNPVPSGPQVADDWWGLSVMSYRSHPGDNTAEGVNDFTGICPQTLMLRDIAALQHMYGANMATRADDTVYAWEQGERLFRTIWDGGGSDAISWANQTTAALIDLNAGQWSRLGPAYSWSEDGGGTIAGTVAIAAGVTIENAFGGSSGDTLVGNAAANTLLGNDGNDSLEGGAESDSVFGGAGNDAMRYLSGADVFYGGTDYDTVDFSAFSGPLTVNLRAGQISYGAAPATVIGNDIERIVTGSGTDNVRASNLAGSRIETGLGDDSASGDDGNDTVEGGGGNDWLAGGSGNDTVFGGDGNDSLTAFLGADTIFGGNGFDTADYRNWLPAVLVNQVSGTVALPDSSVQVLGNDVEQILTGAGNDSIAGAALDNVIDAGAGNDTLDGGAGNDSLSGGSGADRAFGGSGNDTVAGGDGADSILGDAGIDSLSGGLANDTLFGGSERDSLAGGDGNDSLLGGDGADTLAGGNNADRLGGGNDADTAAGDAGNDTLYGGNGNDRLIGGNDVDTLYGEAGNDSLSGGSGNDTLLGGIGTDRMTGDAGADRFVFDDGHAGIGAGVRDVVSGFDGAGGDRIGLGPIDALLSSAGTDQAFAWRGTQAFNAPGQVRYAVTGGNVIIQGSNDASTDVDFEIELSGLSTFQQPWILL